MRLFFTFFEATLVSVASSRRSRRKTKESGTRKGKRHEIVYFLSESLYPASRGPSIFLVKSGRGREDRRTSAHRVERLEQATFTCTFMPAARLGKQCLLQQTVSHALAYAFSVILFSVVMLVFVPAVSGIFHHCTFLLIGLFIWRYNISVQGGTDPLETQLHIKGAIQVSGVPFLL